MTNEPTTPPSLSDLARLLGRKGGSAKSARKTAASRANGQKNAERVRALRAKQTDQPPPGWKLNPEWAEAGKHPHYDVPPTRPTPEAPGNSTQEPAKGA